MSVGFKYPMDLHKDDVITINDPEEGTRWNEKLISEPERQGDKVSIWTDKRHLFADPGLKVQVSI